ncbi:hypothetical protein F5Y06DRAFT_253143 [Hypoxylon sp. FL0890]|nr:hypothetical protein F5Y06DRAFT_253143 [Hypoxylon sp. FL0890]
MVDVRPFQDTTYFRVTWYLVTSLQFRPLLLLLAWPFKHNHLPHSSPSTYLPSAIYLTYHLTHLYVFLFFPNVPPAALRCHLPDVCCRFLSQLIIPQGKLVYAYCQSVLILYLSTIRLFDLGHACVGPTGTLIRRRLLLHPIQRLTHYLVTRQLRSRRKPIQLPINLFAQHGVPNCASTTFCLFLLTHKRRP